MSVPFGAKVLCWNDPKRKATAPTKFGPSSAEGIFLGYHIQPGFIWKGDYIVTPVDGLRDAIEIGKLLMLRVNRVEVPVCDTFPALELSSDKGDSGKPPSSTTRIVMLCRTGSRRLVGRVRPLGVNPKFRVRGWLVRRKWGRDSVYP